MSLNLIDGTSSSLRSASEWVGCTYTLDNCRLEWQVFPSLIVLWSNQLAVCYILRSFEYIKTYFLCFNFVFIVAWKHPVTRIILPTDCRSLRSDNYRWYSNGLVEPHKFYIHITDIKLSIQSSLELGDRRHWAILDFEITVITLNLRWIKHIHRWLNLR